MASPVATRSGPWSYVLRAAVALVFGVLMLSQPGIGLVSFIFAYGLFSLADGLVALVAAFVARRTAGIDWSLLFVGVLGIIVGLFFLFRPLLSVAAMATVIAVWIILVGVMSIVSAIRYRRQMTGEWLIVVAAVFPILFGLYLLARPALTIALLPIMIGGYALFWAALLLITALRLWRHNRGAGARGTVGSAS